MAVSLDRQIFYLPPAVASPKPLSPPLPQKAHDSQPSSAGGSQADAILIPSDDEFDLDGRSDTSFESIDRFLPDARTKVKSACVTGTGMCLDLAFLGRPTC